MTRSKDIAIVGAGIFGAAAALELRRRGYSVVLLDAGRVPPPLAASTDISKVIRMEYGADEDYMALMETALEGWRTWNEEFGETLFHETGHTMLTRAEMAPGGFEYESYQLLIKRGHHADRLRSDEIPKRFPAWRPGVFTDGFYHHEGGFALSGRAVERIVEECESVGVQVLQDARVAAIERRGGSVEAVRLADGRSFSPDTVIVAAGAWTSQLVPELSTATKVTGHPVFHLQPTDPSVFAMGAFTTFMADVSNSGWYGFPLHPIEGVVKIANHGIGQSLGPDDERVVTDADVRSLRRFVEEALPALTDAPITYTRRCLYCDTLDEHFWIDKHPEVQGLFVATGGSGHGFKFGPVFGDLIADRLEDKPNPWLGKFAWRTLGSDTVGEEASRRH